MVAFLAPTVLGKSSCHGGSRHYKLLIQGSCGSFQAVLGAEVLGVEGVTPQGGKRRKESGRERGVSVPGYGRR